MKPKAPKKSVASEREELVQCLRLQEEIDAKLDELVKRFKAVSRAHPNEEVVIEINGILYKLGRPTWEQEASRLGRRHGGFWFDFRLVPLGKPIC
jgi:hypothetical protein